MDTVDIYEVLVREHEQMLLAYVLGLVKDPLLAEDVVQEAFLIGYRKLSTLRDKERFAAWLRTIARNAAFAELRRRNREFPVDQAILDGMEDIFQPFDQPQAGETWEQRLKLVRECVDLLPEKLREACFLYYFEDHRIQQITELLQLGLDAVKKRLERARDGVRECVERRLNLEEA